MIFLKEDIPTIIIPDLHGRFNFLYRVLKFKIDELTVLEELYKGTIQIVCVGDGFHTERQNNRITSYNVCYTKLLRWVTVTSFDS